MNLSIVLPTFDEIDNIGPLVDAIKSAVPAEVEYELIIVDDNSPDGTYDRAMELFAGDPNIVIQKRTTERGLAKSIRSGIELACGTKLIVMDADFTHDPREIGNLVHVGKIYDMVSCSRFCAGGNMQDRAHYLASLIFNRMLKVILRTRVQDNLGGYFIINREKLLALPLDQIFHGYGDYYFRLLHFALNGGMSIVEIPTIYRTRKFGNSKSNFLKMMFSYGIAALKLRTSTRERRLKSVSS